MNDAIGEKISGVFKEYVVDPLKKDNENLSNVLGDIKKDFEEKINYSPDYYTR